MIVKRNPALNISEIERVEIVFRMEWVTTQKNWSNRSRVWWESGELISTRQAGRIPNTSLTLHARFSAIREINRAPAEPCRLPYPVS